MRNIFEEYCIEQFDVQDTIAVNNGTSALIAPLWSMDLKPDDQIITTPFTFIATSNAIIISGGKPVFVDIDPDTLLIDTSKIEEKITDKTKAIIPISLFGQCSDLGKVNKIAKKYNIELINVNNNGKITTSDKKYQKNQVDNKIWELYLFIYLKYNE